MIAQGAPGQRADAVRRVLGIVSVRVCTRRARR